MTSISRTELCKWLRDNSSGIYRHAADAADEIEMLAQLANQHFERAMENGNEVRRLREENERQRFDILAMNQSLDLMREENERMRKDAERYRWLRDYGSTSHLVCRMFVTRYIGSATIPVYQGGALDSAIDAARGAK